MRETDRARDRERQRQRETETETETDSHGQTKRHRQTYVMKKELRRLPSKQVQTSRPNFDPESSAPLITFEMSALPLSYRCYPLLRQPHTVFLGTHLHAV